MNITAIGACDDFHIASIRWDEPKGGIDEMVKIRLQGTTNEIKRMRRVIERNRSLEVRSVSEVFANKGTKKYFRQYMDALKKTKLKEMYLVRYADDFKIFCRNRKDAERVKIAVEKWLKERLHLETSPEKSKITNLCRHYSEFLGFKLKLEERPKQNVIVSHMADKSKKKVIAKLRKAIWDAQGNEDRARNLNMTIRGMHNYYCVATRISNDFWEIYYLLLPSLKHMTRSNGKNGPPQSEFQKRKYATYHGKRFTVGSVTIDPIFAVRFVIPYGFKQETCNYTEELHFIESGGYAGLPTEADEAKDRAEERSRENEEVLEILKESAETDDENTETKEIEDATEVAQTENQDVSKDNTEIIHDENKKEPKPKKKDKDPIEEIENICRRYIPNVDGDSGTTGLVKGPKPKENKPGSTIDVTM